MTYLPENHICCICKVDLGAENGDGICPECDTEENLPIDDVDKNGGEG